jgi:predicted component of type VI protein secretion system
MPGSSFAALAAGLFGLDGPPTDSQRGMAGAIGEAMLRDLINQYRSSADRFGRGVLSVRVHNGKDITRWANADEIRRNLALAEEYDDQAMIDLGRRMLQHLEQLELEHQALLLLCNSSSQGSIAKLFVLDDRSSPAALRQQLEDYAK